MYIIVYRAITMLWKYKNVDLYAFCWGPRYCSIKTVDNKEQPI